jgi:hypothetical protein
MAALCGACHRGLERGPFFFPEEIAEEGMPDTRGNIELRSRMHQHSWISRRLWQGLIGPWDGAWNAGCEELRQLRDDSALPSTLQPRFARMRQLVEPTCIAADPTQRAAVFGAVISECAQCHSTLAIHGDGPAP